MPATLKITATDTLFFGSGRPFTMDEDSWSIGVFPPYPETLYSFLRGCYFVDKKDEYQLAGTENDPTNKLELSDFGLLLEKSGKVEKLYPFPLDLVENKTKEYLDIEKNRKIKFFEKLSLKEIGNEIISNRLPEIKWKLIYEGKDKVRSSDDIYYLCETDFKAYLNGNYNALDPLELKKLISGEPKIGIRRDRFDSTNKSLYRLNLNRLETKESELSIWVTFNGLSFDTNTNRMGGEGKLVFINEYNNESSLESDNNFNKDDIIRMYVATPALFDKGWKPEIEGTEILTAVIGKPLFIGGFDAKFKHPKPTQKAVPAGSVYYFKITKGSVTLPEHIGLNNSKGFGKVFYNKL